MFLKKQIFQLSVLKNLLTTENSCVTLIPTTKLLSLPPCFLNNIKRGIFFILNQALKKYDQNLDGILIGYQNVKILMDERTGLIPMGVADIRVNVSIEFYVFQPKIGGYLQGIVNKKSNSHIGCLVHKYFNASILKPDNVEYDDWECKDIDVDDHIKFKVIDLDFTCYVPRIEGTIDTTNDSIKDHSTKEINSDLVDKIKPNDYEFEKGLLKSEEFWTKKLNKTNWVPNMNTQDSNKNSRKRTFSNMTLSSKTTENESELEKDEFSPKRKKLKKNKKIHKDSEKSEDEKHSEKCNSENDESKQKSNSVPDKEALVTSDVLLNLQDNKNKNDDYNKQNTKDRENIQSSKKLCNSLVPLPEMNENGNLLENKKKEKAHALSNSETKGLELCGTDQVQNISSKKSKKRKYDSVFDQVKTAKIFESTPLKTNNKKSNHITEKQSESDSGVGLEPKESVCSPILFQMPKKNKKSSKTPKASDESLFPEKKSNESNRHEIDTLLLQNSLIEEAKKIFCSRELSPHTPEVELNVKYEDEVDLCSHSVSKKTNKKVKKGSELKKKDLTEKNNSKRENTTSLMDNKPSVWQTNQKIHNSDFEEDEVFRTPELKTSKLNFIKLNENSKNDDCDASNSQNDHEKLLGRLKREKMESLLSEDKNSKINFKKKKRKKEKDDKEKKKEKKVADTDSLCAKLLQDALNNINDFDVEDSNESYKEITEELKINAKSWISSNISKTVEKTSRKKKKEKITNRREESLDEEIPDAGEVENQKEKSEKKKKKKSVEWDSCDPITESKKKKKRKEKDKEEKIKKKEKKDKNKKKEKKVKGRMCSQMKRYD